ncbi:MAG: methionyl-tRNA formyltransferase, partial [Bdellovibrionales bacterium]|nr:methionyl-tRNA formyltransferase [Bdellovibrionales bacterium]
MFRRPRAVFMGTPEFAIPSLAAAHQICDLVAVYTQPDRPVGRGMELKAPPVKQKAIELGIDIFQPEKLSQPGEYERLQALRPELVIVVAYGQILKQNVLDLPPLGCINVHASVLPRWRGAAPIQWAILSGDPETGVSTQKMVAKLDAGDVLVVEKTAIFPDDTSQTLHDRLAMLGAKALAKTIEGLVLGTLRGVPQDESGVTMASKLTKDMERIDCSKTVLEIDRQVRAFTPWPGTSVMLEETSERLKIRRVIPRSEVSARPGMLFGNG